MKKIKIMVDSTSTIPIDLSRELDVKKIKYQVNDVSGKIVVDDFTIDTLKNVMNEIDGKNYYKSCLCPPTIIEEKINKYLQNYDQVFYITASSQYTGQYEAVKYLQDKHPGRVFILNSNSICTVTEELVYKIIDHYKSNDNITINELNQFANEINERTTTLFIPKNLNGLIHSGRIPASLIKLLKFARVTPIVKAEEKNKACKIIKNSTADVYKLFECFDDIFDNKLNNETIRKVYIFNSAVSKEKVDEMIKAVKEYYKISDDKIYVRVTPLPVAIYTLNDSFGIGIHANVKKKS